MCVPLRFGSFKSTLGLPVAIFGGSLGHSATGGPSQSSCGGKRSHGAPSKKVRPSLEMEICIAPQCALAPYLCPETCDHPAAAKTPEASGCVFTLKVKTCCSARPSHMSAAGVVPPLQQDVVCPITLLRILSGILSSAFSKTGLRENLFAHVNTNRSNMLRTGEIPARVRLVRKARGSPKLQQFSLGWLRRITRQSHSETCYSKV